MPLEWGYCGSGRGHYLGATPGLMNLRRSRLLVPTEPICSHRWRRHI